MRGAGGVARVGGGDQSSGPVAIMSSPVSSDTRRKVWRDLPELRRNQYCGNVAPDPCVTGLR